MDIMLIIEIVINHILIYKYIYASYGVQAPHNVRLNIRIASNP